MMSPRSSRSFDLLNSMIYDLKRSVDLRWLLDPVLYSSLGDLVSALKPPLCKRYIKKENDLNHLQKKWQSVPSSFWLRRWYGAFADIAGDDSDNWQIWFVFAQACQEGWLRIICTFFDYFSSSSTMKILVISILRTRFYWWPYSSWGARRAG